LPKSDTFPLLSLYYLLHIKSIFQETLRAAFSFLQIIRIPARLSLKLIISDGLPPNQKKILKKGEKAERESGERKMDFGNLNFR